VSVWSIAVHKSKTFKDSLKNVAQTLFHKLSRSPLISLN